MWERVWNRANPGIVPAWGRSSSNRGLGNGNSLCKTHGRTAPGSGSGGDRSRHGGGGSGGGRSRHNGNESGGYSSSDGRRARVRAVGKGRRRLPYFRLEAMSSARLHHGWAGEGEEMERMGGGGFSKMILQ